ncbi:MAG: hypothetical protein CMI54_03075 [Parcubacteria group bacterium]|jgi:glucosamine 6-phosphate synthetase-like amidotransferase/phosphosugar isomerase protein|nr:hypothetical protein [Parcubacteria group bacterium]|tara:strand:+ start:1766 stop:2731 length:966 start_codon:yes stop_codon:yes gene_type:complete
MCGLAGVVIKQKNRSKSELGEIQNLVSELLCAAEVRGSHASGMAIVDRDGAYLIHKKPMAATDMVRTEEFGSALDLIDKNTGAAICHTRFATQGSPKINKNNHPLRAGTVIGTHNGWVSNDDELFDKYSLKRFAKVDSEVLFRMIDSADTPETFYKDMLKNVSGKVSMVWADIEFPEYVYMYKGNNPLHMVYLEAYEIFAYASTAAILNEALKWSGMQLATRKGMSFTDWTAIRINTKTGEIKKTKNVKLDIPVYKYNTAWNAGYLGNRYTDAVTAKQPNTTKYGGTVAGFVPRYSWREKLAADGSTIKTANVNGKKKGDK